VSVLAPSSATRLFATLDGRPADTLRAHLRLRGAPGRRVDLLDEVAAAGLTGRGGAGFPTAVKARFVAQSRGRRRVVVVNAMEGEPAAVKDATLVLSAPHLVLDGAQAMARAIRADGIVVAVAQDNPDTDVAIRRAVAQRAASDEIEVEVLNPPGRYVAGEESALVHWLSGGESVPTFRRERPSLLAVGRAAVLVDNAETLAHVALIDRFGAEWFRAMGDADAPGTALFSVWPARQGVCVEAPTDITARKLLESVGFEGAVSGILLGGYGGTFVPPEVIDLPLTTAALGPYGASRGAGIVFAVPTSSCGLVEAAAIARYMARESAGQCGPCAFGLPAIAEDMDRLARGLDHRALDHLTRRTAAVDGRGACRHPDGVVRMVRSALQVFAKDAERHASGRPCEGASRRPVAPTPDHTGAGWR
jgi:NADH:ubiquinone oxidoreductase subunit F (NADH-binding)